MKKVILCMILCAGALNGMEPERTIPMERHTPKIYIKNQNTSAYKSPGVLCKINGEQLIFVPMNTTKLIGQAGNEGDIKTLILQPSTAGTPRSGWLIGMIEYDLTKKLWLMLASQESYNRDIEIVVDNKSLSGAWNIQMRWIEDKPKNLLERLQHEWDDIEYGALDDEGARIFSFMNSYTKDVISSSASELYKKYNDLLDYILEKLSKYIEKNSSIVGIQRNVLMDTFKQLHFNYTSLGVKIPTVQANLLMFTTGKMLTDCIAQLNLIQESISKIRTDLASIKFNIPNKIYAQTLLLTALDNIRLITVHLLVLLTDELQRRDEGSGSLYSPESSEGDDIFPV